MERKFECRICLGGAAGQSGILHDLQRAFPAMQWSEGDSSWDKIRVSGKEPSASVRVFRYEEPGPFDLTIGVDAAETDLEPAYLALRDRVLAALHGKLWKRLEPQPVTLVTLDGRFPAAYEFECDLTIQDIKEVLDEAAFWSWQAGVGQPYGYHVVGSVPFRLAGQYKWNYHQKVRILGDRPRYKIEVGHWPDEPDHTPSCAEVHEIVQNTILPALGARNVTSASA